MAMNYSDLAMGRTAYSTLPMSKLLMIQRLLVDWLGPIAERPEKLFCQLAGATTRWRRPSHKGTPLMAAPVKA